MISIRGDYPYKNYRLANAWHLDYYVSSERSTMGTTSYSIIQFKNNYPQHVQRWCSAACEALGGQGIQFSCILRALGSKELRPCGTKPLDALGAALAKTLNCPFLPEILYKQWETPPMHTLSTVKQRKEAIHGVYSTDASTLNLSQANVLIIDDVTTGGVTLEEILRCLQTQWPGAMYYFFALARTQKKPEFIL